MSDTEVVVRASCLALACAVILGILVVWALYLLRHYIRCEVYRQMEDAWRAEQEEAQADGIEPGAVHPVRNPWFERGKTRP